MNLIAEIQERAAVRIFTAQGRVSQLALQAIHDLSAVKNLADKIMENVKAQIKEQFKAQVTDGAFDVPAAPGVWHATLTKKEQIFVTLDKVEVVLGKEARNRLERELSKTVSYTLLVK